MGIKIPLLWYSENIVNALDRYEKDNAIKKVYKCLEQTDISQRRMANKHVKVFTLVVIVNVELKSQWETTTNPPDRLKIPSSSEDVKQW